MRLSVGVLLCFVPGCLNPQPPDGTVTCAKSGPQCPDGYYCEAISNACWKNGDAPSDMSASISDGPSSQADLEAPLDLTVLKSNGASCADAGECTSGFCADGVCCAVACTDACTSCKVPGQEGACVTVAAGSPSPTGHAACVAELMSTCGKDGLCDGKGACRSWPLGTICKPASCSSSSNLFTPQSTCDGNGACQTPATLSCAPFICKDATSCWSTCSSSAQCSGTNTCSAMSCGLKSNGASCTSGSQCLSGNCVDTVCCNATCSGTCQYCALSTSLGTCALVPAGQDPRLVCPANGACVPGGCDGSKMSCALAASTVSCRAASCASNTETLPANCDGTGHCPATMTQPCAPYVCGASACKTTCTTDADCQPGNYCSGTTCVSQKALAQPCTADDQCASAHCAPEGICCSQACTAQCQHCESGTGVCKYTNGAPVSPRSVCTGQGTAPCGGSCNGSSAACTYPTVSCGPPSSCGYQSLNQHYYTLGYGSCSSGTCQQSLYDCGKYACGSCIVPCCASSCTSDSDCNTTLGYHCSGTTCQ